MQIAGRNNQRRPYDPNRRPLGKICRNGSTWLRVGRLYSAIEQATYIHIAEHINRRAAAVEEPIDREQQRDVLDRQPDRIEDERHRYEPRFWDSGRAYRSDDGRQHDQ